MYRGAWGFRDHRTRESRLPRGICDGSLDQKRYIVSLMTQAS